MNIFITGGTGFIGRRVTRRALTIADRVVVLTREPESATAAQMARAGAVCVRGDITDPASVREAMRSADLVIHCGAHYEYGIVGRARDRMASINIEGTRNVLDRAAELRIPRTVYVSSVIAYGDSGPAPRDETFDRLSRYRSTYEQTKSDAHRMAVEYQRNGHPLVIACPNGVIGPNDHGVWGYLLRMYLCGILPPAGWAPDAVSALVGVDDLADGIMRAAERGRAGETYFFSGEPKSVREHVEFWYEAPGGSRIRLWMPPSVASVSLTPIEPLLRAMGLPAFLSRETVRMGTTNLNYTSAKAKRELGWSPGDAGEMWRSTIAVERDLLISRRSSSLSSRLRPLPEP